MTENEMDIINSLRDDIEESERIYRVVIRGRPPGILMNNIEGMMKQLGTKARKVNQKPTYEEEAERGIIEDEVSGMLDDWFPKYHFPPDDLDQLIDGVLL